MQQKMNNVAATVSSTTPCVLDSSTYPISHCVPTQNAMALNQLSHETSLTKYQISNTSLVSSHGDTKLHCYNNTLRPAVIIKANSPKISSEIKSYTESCDTKASYDSTTTYETTFYETNNGCQIGCQDVKPLCYSTFTTPVYDGKEASFMTPTYNVLSPTYNPTTPIYNPISPICNPTTPIYNPISPNYIPPTDMSAPTTTTTTITSSPIIEQPTLRSTSFSDCLRTEKLARKFCSINENLFYFLQKNFTDAIVHNIQRLSRAEIISLLHPNQNTFIQTIDHLMQTDNWSIYRRLSKPHMLSRDEIIYTYNVESQRETADIRKIFFEDDMLALNKLDTVSYLINFFDIDHRIQYKFQQCAISSVCWTRTMYTQSGQTCVEVLEKLLHKNGRYDYNYSLIWELNSLTSISSSSTSSSSSSSTVPLPADYLDIEINNFEAFLRYKIPRVMAILLDDVHQRQNWCDNMLTLKPTRFFSIAAHGKKDSAAWARAMYIAPKIDGERCFGFLSSSGLLVITSTSTHNISDPGVRNLKQTYYVVVERVGNLFFLIDIMSILQFTINLNPSFTSNNKMFETDLYPINVSVTDSIKYITQLPTETILKNSFTRISDLVCRLDQMSDEQLQALRPYANISYDGYLTFSDDVIYKIKQTHTVELEVCLRSLLIQKLNETKPPPAMHRFLKQWKKKQIIVGPILFRAFPVKELADIFRHVYFSNKERFCLTPIDWGNYINDPKKFIRHHFSTFCNRRVDTGSVATAATSTIHEDTVPIMEILNTRVIVEFSCSNQPDTSPPQPYLKYLRIRYDKLKADSPQKVKNIVSGVNKKKQSSPQQEKEPQPPSQPMSEDVSSSPAPIPTSTIDI